MKVNPAIFRSYDIRGVYEEDFDTSFAQRLGPAVAGYLRADTVVVGRDARLSSDDLAYALIDGLTHHGVHVIDVGEVSTPQFYWANRFCDAAGGIMVTASHNPDRYNGFKVVARRGKLLDVVDGAHLRQIVDHPAVKGEESGEVTFRDIVDDYAAAVAYAARWSGGQELLCSIDAPASVTRVLERLGPIAPDERFAIRMDRDGDRISFFLDGELLPPDILFLALAQHMQLQPLVFDLRFSRSVREDLSRTTIPFSVSPVGRSHLTKLMHDTGAAFGAELSGHYYWKTMGGMESPELTLLQVHHLCDGDPDALRSIIGRLTRYARSEEINIPLHDTKRVRSIFEHLEREFAGCKKEHLDGLTIDCWERGGYWFNVRPSNTESVLRLVVEAQTKNLLDVTIQQVKRLLA